MVHWTWANEAPGAWQLFGREHSGAAWALVDTVTHKYTESVTYRHVNRTCDSPGYYVQYRFVFNEWARARNDARWE